MKQRGQKNKVTPPSEPWQVGAYSRKLNLSILLPYPFLLLCKTMGGKTRRHHHRFFRQPGPQLLEKRRTRQRQTKAGGIYSSFGLRQKALYRRKHDADDKELDAMGLLFPKDGEDKILDSYVTFREHPYKHWFNHWYYQCRRKEL